MRRVLLALSFVLCAAAVQAQVVFDANATATCASNGVTTKDCATLTVGSGANRALVCQIIWSGTTGAISVFNWDQLGTPQALTQITNAAGTNTVRSELWGLVNPTSGAKTLRVTWTTSRDVVINCLSYTGVDQTGGTTTFAHGTSATGSATPTSVTVTSAANNAVVAAHGMTAGTVTAVNNTSSFIDNTPTNMSTAGNRAAGAATVTLTSTVSGGPPTWVSVGADIVAASGGGGTPGCKNGVLLLGAGCE